MQEAIPPIPPAAATRSARPQFTGNGGEYFRIWLVNLFLCILTLGFYIPWARVRTRRYFYRSTLLDGHHFDYLADPKRLLLGYIVVGTFFIFYNVSQVISVFLTLAIFAVFMGVFPWLLWKSFRFFAVNSSHRQIRFGFLGTLKESYATYLGFPLLALLTCGLAFPAVLWYQKKYFFDRMQYGSLLSRYRGSCGIFFAVYYAIFGVVFGLFMLLIVAMTALESGQKQIFKQITSALEHAETSNGHEAGKNGGTELPVDAETATPSEEAGTGEGTAEEDPAKAGNDSASLVESNPEEKEEESDEMSKWFLGGVMAGVFLFYAGLIFGGIAASVLITNHMWNHTRLEGRSGEVVFKSDIHVGRYLWIAFSNILLLVLTLGLFFPWAKIRLFRYRLESLEVQGLEVLEQTLAQAASTGESAYGDTAADLFDFEIGL
jgi:uncharacterized membrane protein YjgN (DUF898 family)